MSSPTLADFYKPEFFKPLGEVLQLLRETPDDVSNLRESFLAFLEDKIGAKAFLEAWKNVNPATLEQALREAKKKQSHLYPVTFVITVDKIFQHQMLENVFCELERSFPFGGADAAVIEERGKKFVELFEAQIRKRVEGKNWGDPAVIENLLLQTKQGPKREPQDFLSLLEKEISAETMETWHAVPSEILKGALLRDVSLADLVQQCVKQEISTQRAFFLQTETRAIDQALSRLKEGEGSERFFQLFVEAANANAEENLPKGDQQKGRTSFRVVGTPVEDGGNMWSVLEKKDSTTRSRKAEPLKQDGQSFLRSTLDELEKEKTQELQKLPETLGQAIYTLGRTVFKGKNDKKIPFFEVIENKTPWESASLFLDCAKKLNLPLPAAVVDLVTQHPQAFGTTLYDMRAVKTKKGESIFAIPAKTLGSKAFVVIGRAFMKKLSGNGATMAPPIFALSQAETPALGGSIVL
ncbi:MAG: hypothetical protein V1746_00265 [bacterium]